MFRHQIWCFFNAFVLMLLTKFVPLEVAVPAYLFFLNCKKIIFANKVFTLTLNTLNNSNIINKPTYP